jgi:hypothetical protein
MNPTDSRGFFAAIVVNTVVSLPFGVREQVYASSLAFPVPALFWWQAYTRLRRRTTGNGASSQYGRAPPPRRETERRDELRVRDRRTAMVPKRIVIVQERPCDKGPFHARARMSESD